MTRWDRGSRNMRKRCFTQFWDECQERLKWSVRKRTLKIGSNETFKGPAKLREATEEMSSNSKTRTKWDIQASKERKLKGEVVNSEPQSEKYLLDLAMGPKEMLENNFSGGDEGQTRTLALYMEWGISTHHLFRTPGWNWQYLESG